jgi:signal transduction histidine kinase/streptogramin lyase
MVEDREGTLWIATDNGLDAFHDLSVLTLPRSQWGVSDLDNVITTRDGTLWVGANGALLTLKKGASGFIPRGGNLGGKQVATIFEDHRGRMWIGVDDALNILSGDSFQPVRMPDGGPVGMIVSMAEETDGDLWAVSLGPPRHVIRIDPDMAKVSSVPDMPETSKIARDPRGGFWLGLNNGDLNHYDKGELTRYPLHRGPGARIQQLSVQDNGDVIAAAPFGLIQWQSGTTRVLDDEGGLPCSNINSFVFDLQGNLWLYMNCGLAEVAEADFKGWQQDPAHKVLPRVFSWMDGVRINFPPFEGAARSGDGRLWFNNQQALQVVDPARIAKNLVLPPVHIEAVIADRITYPPLDGLRLPKLTHDLEIDYTALSLIAPQKVQFRYMLSGVDQGWQDVGVRRQAFYMNLKPGPYAFRVVACNNDGVWNEAGAALTFSIPPVFYQTSWFRLLGGSLLLTVLALLYQLRLRQLARQYNGRLELQQARTALAHRQRVGMFGEVAASLAHEIRQPIAAARIDATVCLLTLGDERLDLRAAREAAARMVKDATWADEIIKRTSALYKKDTTHRERVDINALIREMALLLQQEASASSVSIRTDLAEDNPDVMADRVQLQQVLMNLMLNAIEAMQHTDGGALRITSHASEETELLIAMSDTGVGLPTDNPDRIFESFVTTKPQGTGIGLAITRSIVESHGGRLWAVANTGPGATFLFTLPRDAGEPLESRPRDAGEPLELRPR